MMTTYRRASSRAAALVPALLMMVLVVVVLAVAGIAARPQPHIGMYGGEGIHVCVGQRVVLLRPRLFVSGSNSGLLHKLPQMDCRN